MPKLILLYLLVCPNIDMVHFHNPNPRDQSTPPSSPTNIASNSFQPTHPPDTRTWMMPKPFPRAGTGRGV